MPTEVVGPLSLRTWKHGHHQIHSIHPIHPRPQTVPHHTTPHHTSASEHTRSGIRLVEKEVVGKHEASRPSKSFRVLGLTRNHRIGAGATGNKKLQLASSSMESTSFQDRYIKIRISNQAPLHSSALFSFFQALVFSQ